MAITSNVTFVTNTSQLTNVTNGKKSLNGSLSAVGFAFDNEQ